ncbi:segregation and condensation protein B [Micromonospora coriariae]|uniref:Segregation and condensation protein B n=1 Tax=Micromonospora coriariae TaxID=285665 RepID=A0A1C4U7J8_9ACTN|nr:SMC-Scp complex subunit ScpB [Micromonospora coriariae]SCE67622.1 segregation and condensation protein B [Micromonospora coriariae]
MSDEERRDSLADQAAAWVPPWERPRPPAPTTPEVDETTAETDKDPVEGPTPDTAVPAQSTAEDLGAEPPLQEPESSTIAGAASAGGLEPGAGESDAPVVGEGGAGDVPPGPVVGRRRAPAAPEPAPELSDAELRGALEAILLVVDEPVSELVLAQVVEQPAERVGPMLDEIAAGYTAAGHGFELRRAAGGWRLYTRPEYATYVERFVLDGQSVRLTQAALETLAVVAYKQPVTRSRISAIRGVNCDGVIRTLVTRGLVEECGTEPDSGAFLYRTTTLFLEKLGLNTVDELPPLAPFLPDDVEELADATR